MIDDAAPPAASVSAALPLPIWLGVMAGLTVFAATAGMGLGFLLAGTASQENPSPAVPATKVTKYSGEINVRELPPVIANLAEPSDAWIRVQASIVFDRNAVPKPDVVAAEIGEDILGFLRTLSMAQIGGASGLQHLREDLNERAVIRSGGLVRELIIQTLVVQ